MSINEKKKRRSNYFAGKRAERRRDYFAPVSSNYKPEINTFGNQVVGLFDYLQVNPSALTDGAVDRVLGLMHSLEEGMDLDLLSPFAFAIYNELCPDSSSEDRRFAARLLVDGLLESCPLFERSPVFRNFELENREKVGTTSIAKPYTIGFRGGVNAYFSTTPQHNLTFDREILSQSFERVSKLLPICSVVPVSLDYVYEKSDKTTQWGAPYYYHGNDIVNGEKAGELYLADAKEQIASGRVSKFLSVMTKRIQPNGTDFPKHRVAWMISHIPILVEVTYLSPLLDALKLTPEFSEHRGINYTDSFVASLFRKSDNYDDFNLLGFDASAYDTTLCKELITHAYNLMIYWFGDEHTDIITGLMDNMIGSDLVTPEGIYVARDSSVASGMGLTNLIDCLCQLLLFEYTAILIGADISKCHKTVNGDDGIWVMPGLTPELLSDVLSTFGMVSNPDKASFSSDYVTFCQRLYLKGFKRNSKVVGIRSAYRSINSICSYETKPRRGWNSACDSVRCIMQLNEMRHNPIHDELTKFMIRADREFGLGAKHPGLISGVFKEAGGIERVTHLAGGSSWDRDRSKERSKGIHKLETVQLIMSTVSQGG